MRRPRESAWAGPACGAIPLDSRPPASRAPCPRCGREARVQFNGFRVEHLKMVGWRHYQVESYVTWCGHAQEVIPGPS